MFVCALDGVLAVRFDFGVAVRAGASVMWECRRASMSHWGHSHGGQTPVYTTENPSLNTGLFMPLQSPMCDVAANMLGVRHRVNNLVSGK